jgi:hypothetical protein
MSEEPLQVDRVEYYDAEPIPRRGPVPDPIVYQSEGLPCCSGCGCLGLMLFVLIFGAGSLLTGIVILITAAVLASAVMRLSGVRRFSPAYAYVLVPVFLICVQFATKLFKHVYPYTTVQLIGATLLVWVFLYLARGLGRR